VHVDTTAHFSSFIIFMSLPRDTVGESIMFLGCPVRLSSQILSLRYIMNGLNNLDETDG